MMAPLDSTPNPNTTERRSCERQKVLFSSVVISDKNHGRVLNISRNGLALETDSGVVDDEFPSLRFQFSPRMAWVEARGRVAWKNGTTKVVGIEFTGVTAEAQKEIESWIELRRELLGPSRPNESAAEAYHTVRSEPSAEITAASSTPASDLFDLVAENEGEASLSPSIPHPTEADGPLTRAFGRVDLDAENKNEPPIVPPVQYQYPTQVNAERTPASDLGDLSAASRIQPPPPPLPRWATEATDAPTIEATEYAGEYGKGIGGGASAGKTLKLVGLALLAVLLLTVLFVRGFQLRKSANIQKNKEQTGAVRPVAAPSQPVQPAPSGERPAVPSWQPAASASSSAVTVPNPKPTMHGPSYVLQVGAMIHEENANALADSLRRMNFHVFLLRRPNERFHYVLVGPYESVDAAIKVKNDLEKRGFQAIRKEWKVAN
jgi:cell division septation protein DedD